jgi:hypothetical protein
MDKSGQIVNHQRQTNPIISNLYNTVLYYMPQQKQEICFILCRRQKTILISTKIYSVSRALYFFTGSIRYYHTWRLVRTCLIPKVDLHKIRPEVSLSSSLPSVKCAVWSAHKFWWVSCHFSSLTFMASCTLNIFQYVSSKMQLYTVYLYLETALHVSGGISTRHQERIQLYLQHLVLVKPLLLSAAIAADSSNGVTNTRCCKYSCMRSWWWVEAPPETCRAVSRYK